MLRHNAIEAWDKMLKTGCQRCRLPVRLTGFDSGGCPNCFDQSGVLGRESAFLAYLDTPVPKAFDPAGPEVTDHHQNGANGPDAENQCQGWIDPDPDQGQHHPQSDQQKKWTEAIGSLSPNLIAMT